MAWANDGIKASVSAHSAVARRERIPDQGPGIPIGIDRGEHAECREPEDIYRGGSRRVARGRGHGVARGLGR